MNLKHKIATLVAAFALAALPTLQVSAKGSYYFDFSGSLKPWASSAEGSSTHSLQLLMENDPKGERPTNLYANLSAEDAVQKQESANRDVPLPIGTWAVANFPTEGDRLIRLHLSARSTSNCEGCDLMVYVGKAEPAHITQFNTVDGNSLKSYWQTYSYEVELIKNIDPTSGPEQVFIAIGWSGDDASIGLDNITVDIYPAP